ncbi:MAG: hypothetical protein ACRDT8_11270 [Micromonosporaceae bacterium]
MPRGGGSARGILIPHRGQLACDLAVHHPWDLAGHLTVDDRPTAAPPPPIVDGVPRWQHLHPVIGSASRLDARRRRGLTVVWGLPGILAPGLTGVLTPTSPTSLALARLPLGLTLMGLTLSWV